MNYIVYRIPSPKSGRLLTISIPIRTGREKAPDDAKYVKLILDVKCKEEARKKYLNIDKK